MTDAEQVAHDKLVAERDDLEERLKGCAARAGSALGVMFLIALGCISLALATTLLYVGMCYDICPLREQLVATQRKLAESEKIRIEGVRKIEQLIKESTARDRELVRLEKFVTSRGCLITFLLEKLSSLREIAIMHYAQKLELARQLDRIVYTKPRRRRPLIKLYVKSGMPRHEISCFVSCLRRMLGAEVCTVRLP